MTGVYSVSFYFLWAMITSAIFYSFGTDAIRYLNNDYWADPYLIPSFLYSWGFAQHKDPNSFNYDDFDSDNAGDEDIPLEDW